MAFTVTPTSGEGPYVLDALISNREMIDDVNYGLRVMRSNAETPCPVVATGVSIGPIVEAFLAGNEYADALTIPNDLCRTYTVVLTDLSTNTVIGEISQSVSNI